MATFKQTVQTIAESIILEKGEVTKQEIYGVLMSMGYSFDPLEERAKRADLAQINRVLSSIVIDGKRRFESVRKIVEGKVRFVRIPAPMLKFDPTATAYAREQTKKRIAGEVRKSPVASDNDEQLALDLLKAN